MQKPYLIFLFLAISVSAFSQIDENRFYRRVLDNTKQDFGGFLKGLQIPTDTSYTKKGIAQIGDTIFIGDGIKWKPSISSTSDTVINNIYHGSTSGLRSLNNSAVIQANTEDYGKGIFVRDTSDHTTADNWGTVIVSADGGRFKRQYDGYDNFLWYKSTGGTDSAALMMAIMNCGSGVFAGSGTYEMRWVRICRDNIDIVGVPGKTIFKMKPSAEDGNSIFIFKDSVDHKISNVTIKGIRFEGNSGLSSGANNATVKVGGPYGGPSTDTTRDITFEDCYFFDAPAGGAFWMISDTLKSSGWKFINNTFDSAQKVLVAMWGGVNPTWEGNTFKNWGCGDTSNSAFFMGASLIKGLYFHKNNFYAGNGGRFAVEYAVNLVNAKFDGNYYNGNGRGASGTSGGMCYNCQFINEIKENGDGTWRGGYEINGGGIVIDGARITNGSMTFSVHGGGTPTPPAGYEYLRDSGIVVNNVTLKNDIGEALRLGTSGYVISNGLRDVTISNSSFTTGSNYPQMRIFGVKDLKMYNVTSISDNYNIVLQNQSYSTTDSVSRNLTFTNNIFKGKGTWDPEWFSNIQVGTPESQTFKKYMNVVFENNKHSQRHIYYNDSLVSSWASKGGTLLSDTNSVFRYSGQASFSLGYGSPNGVRMADRGSRYTDIATNKIYNKTTDNSTSGWVEQPTEIFNEARAAGYLLIGKGARFDSTGIVKVDTAKGYVRIGNKDWNPDVSLLVAQDSTISSTGSIYMVNPKKTGLRTTQYVARDGNNEGVKMAWNGTYTSFETMGNYPMRFYTNALPRLTLSAGGNVGIANTVPGYQFTLGSAGAGATMALYGNTAGYILIKAPDNITSNYTIIPPSDAPAVGKVWKVVSYTGGVAQFGWADDNTGGGGSGSSGQGTVNF